jgi:hypothetical protein
MRRNSMQARPITPSQFLIFIQYHALVGPASRPSSKKTTRYPQRLIQKREKLDRFAEDFSIPIYRSTVSFFRIGKYLFI